MRNDKVADNEVESHMPIPQETYQVGILILSKPLSSKVVDESVLFHGISSILKYLIAGCLVSVPSLHMPQNKIKSISQQRP